MNFKVVIFALLLSTTLAYPLQNGFRGAAWADTKTNQAHDKADLTKDMDKIYKSIIDSSALYNHEGDDAKNPVAEEMQQKLTMESERLRVRLRQELAELRERLSPSPAHLSATLASIRERLTPLTQQLQSSLSSNAQDLCSQLSSYLQGLEMTETAAESSPALHQEAFQWLSQTLKQNTIQLANMISEFRASASAMMEDLKQGGGSEEDAENSKMWQDVTSRLEQEVSSLKEAAQKRVEILNAQLAALQESVQPHTAEVKGTVERFCENTAQQSQELQAWMEKLFKALEEELHATSSVSFSLPVQHDSSLQEDFTVKLSALIQDILHSVQ
ncbi:apolipoprotein A-I [Oryzias melastigma]|uniref:Zgc:162608 n=1 Tax=Oryzias melastigma TaxID=30732 RepID=A0A3B3C6X4_ORYME|nr:apolipoprotein A-I [Oryzias melastigma]XP_036070936.1 apolipoprotein A-I [Oryzias melastigma]